MMKKALKVFVWFQVTTILLLVNLTFLSLANASNVASSNLFVASDVAVGESLGTGKVLSATIETADARSLLLTQFMKKYQPNSPMLPYANQFVTTADTYQLDFRLIPAIAMCESNLGTRIPTKDSYNAWGIAVYTGQQSGKKFNDWEHAIDWVGSYIREKFYNRAITDLLEIGAIWAPPSVSNENSWATCVSGFMEKIR